MGKILFRGSKQKARHNKNCEGSILISCLEILFAVSIAFIVCASFLNAKLSYLQKKSDVLYSSFLIAEAEDSYADN